MTIDRRIVWTMNVNFKNENEKNETLRTKMRIDPNKGCNLDLASLLKNK